MIAHVTNLKPGEFIHTTGDTHIYQNHLEQVDIQLARSPKSLPRVRLSDKVKSLFDFNFEDIILEDYNPDPGIKAKVAV